LSVIVIKKQQTTTTKKTDLTLKFKLLASQNKSRWPTNHSLGSFDKGDTLQYFKRH